MTASTIAQFNETFKGVSEIKLQRLSDNAILQLPIPASFMIDNQIEQRQQVGRDGQGLKVRTGSYPIGKMPIIKLVYSYMQPELLQFKIGNEFATTTDEISVIKTYRITQNTYPAITNNTQLGYGVTQDQSSQAAIKRNSVSVQLTQQPFNTFDPTIEDSFAVGAAMAVKFSNNLVSEVDICTIITQESASILSLSDNPVEEYQLLALTVTTLNQIVNVKVFSCFPSFDGSTIDFSGGAESIEIPLFVNHIEGNCIDYDIIWTGQYVNC